MLLRLRGSGKDGFWRPLRPSELCLSVGTEQGPSRGSTKSGGCEGGRAAVKIRCLLGRSRLRRKRGRLFLRLGWRSQNERPATRLIGLTPLELFSSVTAVRKYSTRRFWPCGRRLRVAKYDVAIVGSGPGGYVAAIR